MIEKKLKELGLEIPEVAAPKAMYVPFQKTGNLVFISGQLPTKGGELIYSGRVGEAVTLEQAQECAKQCAVNIIAAAKGAAGNLNKVKRIVKLQGFVNSTAEFDKQHLVVNGASQLLFEVFGEAGMHARTVVGVAALPLGAPVEVEAIIEVEE